MPEGATHVGDEVGRCRAKIFELLLFRLRFLHVHRPSPSAYYIGQEYVEDKECVDGTITATFLFPGEVDTFEFWLNRTKVSGQQCGNTLVITAHRKVSAQLWDDLRLKGIGQQFIIGYLTSLMPSVNRRLLDNRYRKGHLLSRTFAVFEAVELTFTVEDRRLWLPWPPSLPSFPPTAEFAGHEMPIYVRDFIDSVGAFFRYEYEDTIRRVITATENFLDSHGWRGGARRSATLAQWIRAIFRRGRIRRSFRRRLADNLDLSRISDKVINSNLQDVYTIRNRIVHSSLRMGPRSGVFCDKALGALYYLISDHCGDAVTTEYMCTLQQQYVLTKNFLGQMYDLDRISSWNLTDPSEAKVPETDDEFDAIWFESLRITDADKRGL